MNKTTILYFALPALALCSCDNDGDRGTVLKPAEQIELSAAESRASSALNDFGLEFFAKASAEADANNDNLTLSPLGASMFASLISNACDDADASTIANMLGCEDRAALNSYSAKLVNRLSTLDPSSKFSTANSLWHQNGTSVTEAFADAAKTFYGIEMFERNFDSPNTGDEITRWVSNHSSGLIKDFEASLTGDMTLLNVIYYKGIWETPFQTKNTTKSTFNGSSKTSTVDMMHNTSHYAYAYNEISDAVKLDFGNGAFHAILVLPAENSSLTAAQLSEIINAGYATNYTVNLSFPKFAYRQTKFDITKLFTDKGVNLNNIKVLDNGGRFDSVIQEGLVQFDETGVELAVISSSGPISPGPGNEVDLNFNRPFYFFIRDGSTGSMLLAGKINNL